jgi:hypothetical protein
MAFRRLSWGSLDLARMNCGMAEDEGFVKGNEGYKQVASVGDGSLGPFEETQNTEYKTPDQVDGVQVGGTYVLSNVKENCSLSSKSWLCRFVYRVRQTDRESNITPAT